MIRLTLIFFLLSLFIVLVSPARKIIYLNSIAIDEYGGEFMKIDNPLNDFLHLINTGMKFLSKDLDNALMDGSNDIERLHEKLFKLVKLNNKIKDQVLYPYLEIDLDGSHQDMESIMDREDYQYELLKPYLTSYLENDLPTVEPFIKKDLAILNKAILIDFENFKPSIATVISKLEGHEEFKVGRRLVQILKESITSGDKYRELLNVIEDSVSAAYLDKLEYFDLSYDAIKNDAKVPIDDDDDDEYDEDDDDDEWGSTKNKVGVVLPLTDATFERLTQASSGATSGNWAVIFQSENCIHCKNMAPAFQQAAYNLHGVVIFASVDAENNLKLSRRFEIEWYPSLFMFSGGFMYGPYKGQRDANSITAWCETGYLEEPTSKIKKVPAEESYFETIVQSVRRLPIYFSTLKAKNPPLLALALVIGALVGFSFIFLLFGVTYDEFMEIYCCRKRKKTTDFKFGTEENKKQTKNNSKKEK